MLPKAHSRANLRTNGYWVLLGIWWCACSLTLMSRKLTSGHLSRIPAATARAKTAKGRELPHDWLETGIRSAARLYFPTPRLSPD